MCVVKSPKPVSVTKDSTPVPVLRNPYLDGIDPMTKARSTGLRSLRIDRGSTPAPTGPLTISRPTAPATPQKPATFASKVSDAVSSFFLNK